MPGFLVVFAVVLLQCTLIDVMPDDMLLKLCIGGLTGFAAGLSTHLNK